MAHHASFGDELRRRRIAASMSLADLARTAHYSKGYLSKIEAGISAANIALARRCDVALGADGALAALIPSDSRRDQPSDDHTPDRGAWWQLTMSPHGHARFDPVSSPADAPTGKESMFGFDLPVHAAVAADDPATVDAYRSLYRQYRHMGVLGGLPLIVQSMIIHTNTLRVLATRSHGTFRQQFLLLGSLCATDVGIVMQDADDLRGARWWAQLSSAMASESGTDGAHANSALLHAEIALGQGDTNRVRTIAETHETDPTVSPRLRSMLAMRVARAHALTGDYDQCMRTLDQASTLLDQDDQRILDDLATGPQSGRHVQDIWTGWCLHDLGRPLAATKILDAEIPHIAVEHRVWRAKFGARRALAYASLGEVDHACTLTSELLDTISTAHIGGLNIDLRQLRRTLGRWRTSPAVRTTIARLNLLLTEHLDNSTTVG